MLSLWEEVTVQFLYSAPDKKSVDAFCTLNVNKANNGTTSSNISIPHSCISVEAKTGSSNNHLVYKRTEKSHIVLKLKGTS